MWAKCGQKSSPRSPLPQRENGSDRQVGRLGLSRLRCRTGPNCAWWSCGEVEASASPSRPGCNMRMAYSFASTWHDVRLSSWSCALATDRRDRPRAGPPAMFEPCAPGRQLSGGPDSGGRYPTDFRNRGPGVRGRGLGRRAVQQSDSIWRLRSRGRNHGPCGRNHQRQGRQQ